MIQAFKPIEKTVKALIEAAIPGVTVRGDLGVQPGDVFVSQIPGSGSSDEVSGSWAVDIDFFGTSWAETMQRALDLEAYLVGARGFIHDGQRIDRVYVNASPADRPWDEDRVFRIGGTYFIRARRA